MIRVVDIPQDQWQECDTSVVIGMFEHIGADPELARLCRGTVWLTFADVGDSEPIMTPEIRRFVGAVHKRLNHALYFLDSDPQAESLAFYIASISDPNALLDDGGPWRVVITHDVKLQIERTLLIVAQFAISRGDDWLAAILGHASGVDRSMVIRVRENLLATGYMRV